MLKKIVNNLPLYTSILFILLLLTNPVNSALLVNAGLTTWYEHMIPSLFPFMVLSGFLLRSGLSNELVRLLYPFLGKIFKLSPNCIYVIIMGFLCGFPMGASVTADSLLLGKISNREADLLLSFCNNIGPIYMLSFATVACPYYPLWICLSIMYGIPFVYGIILRYTVYKEIPYECIYHREYSAHVPNYIMAIQESLQKALHSIIMLGGYMIIFNVLQLPFYNTFYQLSDNILCILKSFIEINSGINAMKFFPQLYDIVYKVCLPFCGLCCLFQTYAMIKDTPLSILGYFYHKIIITICTFLIYSMIKI